MRLNKNLITDPNFCKGSAKHTQGISSNGFALVISLGLMAFVVLLLLSLTTFIRVETQNTNRLLAELNARTNAQLGLMIAIGELQKSTGPDQRVTATADLAARNLLGDRIESGSTVANNNPLGIGERGLSVVQEGTRYWTGVWENRNPAQTAFTSTPSPALVDWLISGNKNANSFTPDLNVDWDSLSNFRVNLGNNQTGILLVGPGSTGNEDQSTEVLNNFGFSLPSSAEIERFRERYIIAPAVSIPSSGISNARSTGNYAYWVGDEGVKARINIADPLHDLTTDTARRLRARVAQRIAGELATAAEEAQPTFSSGSSLSSVPEFNYDDYPFPGNRTTNEALLSLPMVTSRPQFELLRDPSVKANDPQRLQRRFHSVSFSSRGVLSDSLNGGLKQDLNLALENPSLFNAITGGGAGILPPEVAPITGPNWSTVRAYHELASRTSAAINLDVRAPGPGTPAPAIAEIRLLFKLYPNRPVDNSPATWHIRTNVLIGIANPHNVRLDTANLHVVFDRLGQVPNNPSSYYNFGPEGTSGWGSWWVWAMDNAAYNPANPNELTAAEVQAARLHSFRVIHRAATTNPPTTPWSLNGSNTAFIVPATSWAPGEMRYFAIADRDQVVTDAVGQTINLSPIGLGPLETHYFTYDTGVTLPEEDDPDTSEYISWLQFNNVHRGWGGRYNPTGLAAALYRPGDSPLNTSTPTPLTRADISSFYTAWPTVPVTPYAPDLEGAVTSGVLRARTKLPLWSSSDGHWNFARHPYTFRPFADQNIRARFQPPVPLYRDDNIQTYLLFYGRRANAASTFTESPFGDGWAWGGNYHGVDPTSSAVFTPFDLPFQRDNTEPTLLSLGELQHVDLTANDDAESIGLQPGAAVGNSFHVPLMNREFSVQTRNANFYEPPRDMRFFDISYLLNTALFDRFFFSSYAGGSLPTRLPNSRYTIIDRDNFFEDLPGEAPATSPARCLMVEGAFNINSTSMEAWASVLGSTLRVPVAPDGDSLNVGTAFPRSLNQPRGANRAALGNSEDTYGGFRRLTDAELRNLSREMVRQVRQRGPFLSLSHFVNRSLIAADASGNSSTAPLNPPASMGLSGPLQSAIDAAGINNLPRVDTASGINNPFVTLAANTPDGFDNPFWPDYQSDFPALQAVSGSSTQPPQGNRFAGVPGFLTQADVLQVLAPVISARSDTFKIRAYGETLNPDGSRSAQAWCEAIVERRPEFVDSTDTPGTPVEFLTPINQQFGRKYHIVSFRWLSPDEI